MGLAFAAQTLALSTFPLCASADGCLCCLDLPPRTKVSSGVEAPGVAALLLPVVVTPSNGHQSVAAVQ